MPSPIQTLGQQRAAHAWEKVQEALKDSGSFEEFADHAKKLPMRIRASGLGQTWAFLAAKKKASGLRKAVASWCVQRKLLKSDSDEAVASEFRNCSAPQMRLLTVEILAYMEWVVRFADAHKKE